MCRITLIEEGAELLSNVLVIVAFDMRTLFANGPHAVEEQALQLVVLGFFRVLKQRVVNLGEDPAQVFGQAIHQLLTTALHEFAVAWLNAALGDNLRCAGLVLGAH